MTDSLNMMTRYHLTHSDLVFFYFRKLTMQRMIVEALQTATVTVFELKTGMLLW